MSPSATHFASAAGANREAPSGANILSKLLKRARQAAPARGISASTTRVRLHHRPPRQRLIASASPATSARAVASGAHRRRAKATARPPGVCGENGRMRNTGTATMASIARISRRRVNPAHLRRERDVDGVVGIAGGLLKRGILTEDAPRYSTPPPPASYASWPPARPACRPRGPDLSPPRGSGGLARAPPGRR